jgi:hypothetical protein
MKVCYCKIGAGGKPCVDRATCDKRGGTRQYTTKYTRTKRCYNCMGLVSYLFADCRCKDCTMLTREEIEG